MGEGGVNGGVAVNRGRRGGCKRGKKGWGK